MNTVCLPGCGPAQILNLKYAVDDISNISVKDTDGNEYDKCCLEYAYSLDDITWSCYLKYDDAIKNLVDIDSDFFVRLKVNGSIGSVTIDSENITTYTTEFAPCFQFGSSAVQSANMYDPYANMDYAVKLYQQLANNVVNMLGIPAKYFRLEGDCGSADITFKEYLLKNVVDVKQIKLMIADGQMPSSKPEFTDFGFDFQTDWEVEISKEMFATAFGINAQPMEGDIIWIPMMKRMWMVNGAYEEKKDAFMWQAATFKVTLVKYQDKSSVDLGETQVLVDSLVQNKYEDLFGDDENTVAQQETTDMPDAAYIPSYPVFESDAVRKYVRHSNGLVDINARLRHLPKYHRGTLVAENLYDFTSLYEPSYISYQHQFCGEEGTVSFIVSFSDTTSEPTKIFNIADIIIKLEGDTLNFHDLCSISGLLPNTTYFVIARWSRALNICELNITEHTHNPNIPLIKLQNFHWYFDVDNRTIDSAKYDLNLDQSEKKDVVLYSFPGMITNIKVFDIYMDNISEILKMLPNNGHLIINDVANKFVDLAGVPTR